MSKGAMYNVNRNNQDAWYRYKMPAVQTKIEGKGNGIKTVVTNCPAIAEALNRPTEYVCKHFGFELGAQVQMDAKTEKYIVNGQHSATLLQDKLDIFIKNWVLCNLCENPETSLSVFGPNKNPQIEASCKACGEKYLIKVTGRMRKYIEVNPPEKFGLSNKGTAEMGKQKKSKSKHASGQGNDEAEDNIQMDIGNDVDGWGEETFGDDLDTRLDKYLTGDTLTGKLAELTINDDLLAEIDDEKKFEVFVKHVKKIKKSLGKEDFLDELGAEKVKDLADKLRLGPQAVLAFNVFEEFNHKMIDQIEKYSQILEALCENDLKAQANMIGLVEITTSENSKKLKNYAGNIFNKLYSEDILSKEAILAWCERPSKKFSDKKHRKKMREEPNMVKFLEWLENADDSSSSSESEEEKVEKPALKSEPKKEEKIEEPASSEAVSSPEPVKKPAAPAATLPVDDDDDDEDIDIDNI